MRLEIDGTITQKGELKQGDGNKPWQKQEFVITTTGDFSKDVCFTGWNKIVDEINKIQIGSFLKVFFSPESRIYNNKWYTDLKAYRIEVKGVDIDQKPNKVPEFNSIEDSSTDGLPF